jgi:UDP-N-acetylglucosamine--N-acetylmuramyl-(pentapeptide) pyrophosphoryl-undecaprenol N-acetylglucosamine transferase
MRGAALRPVVIAAGGTGGHFFPAEALAAELIARGRRIVLFTDARSGGLVSLVFANQERFVIAGRGVFGRGAWHALGAAASLMRGVVQARRLLARLDAAVVVGFGGYPAVAPALASRLLLRRRPKLVLHDQNAVLGRANRLLARLPCVLALSHAETARVPAHAVSVLTGNPVRPAVLRAARPYEPPAEEFRLLVLGGSLGARVFSGVVPAAVTMLPAALRGRLRITQQCRPEDLARVEAAYAAVGVKARLAAFFPDVAELLAAAHLVVCRGGGSTVAELAVAGRPALIVPLPIAIDDDQGANARARVAAGGAWLLRQPDFTAEALTARLVALAAEPRVLAAAAAAAAAVAIPDAADRLADLVERTIAEDALS